MEYLHKTQTIATAVDEFDFAERIKPAAILEYFQDIATSHADDLGIGYERMRQMNMCWVLSRLRFEIDAFPALGEDIVVTTFPRLPRLAETARDYIVTDRFGKSLFRGTTRWCVLDIQSRKVCRCAPLFTYPNSAYTPVSVIPAGCEKLPALDALEGDTDRVFHDAAKITELDRNGHINNARYADIVVNSCDFDFYAGHTMKSFSINYLSEMLVGTRYTVGIKTRNNASYFEATADDDGKPVFRACVEWA